MVSLSGKVAEAMAAPPGSSYALIANMAVAASHQGRGIGRALFQGLVDKAILEFRPRPLAVLLLVHKSNTAAVRLYTSEGFVECTDWVDPAWLAEAEKGRVGEERRRLFYKSID